MKNRAKCRLCGTIIESFHYYDYVECKCGEISVCGGPECYQTGSKDPSYINFIRVDDEGNEFVVKVSGTHDEPKGEEPPKLTRSDYLKMLDDMIKNIENLPSHAMQTPITHYDLYSSLLLLSTILRAE